MSDPLLAEIVAHPDRDDARLVWADREGGERGELVVVQCALASGSGDRPTRKRLYERERELLKQALKWPEASDLLAPRFERGFIAHAIVKIAELPKLLARHPLLTSVELGDARVDIRSGTPPILPWEETGRRLANVFGELAPGRVAKVKAEPMTWVDGIVSRLEDNVEEFLGALSGTHAGRALRGLDLGRKFPRDAFAWLARWMDLEELRIECDSYGLTSVSEFARTHPRLTRLELRRHVDGLSALPAFSSFEELSISRAVGDIELLHLAGTPMPNLERLALHSNTATESGFRTLASAELPKLESLDLSTMSLDDAKLAILATAKFAPQLKILELRSSNKLTAASIPVLASFPNLDRLDLRSSYADMRMFAPLADVIPSVLLTVV